MVALTFGFIIAGGEAAMRRASGGSTWGPVLARRTIGVIGLGTIGSRVAAVGWTFGMGVAGTEPEPPGSA